MAPYNRWKDDDRNRDETRWSGQGRGPLRQDDAYGHARDPDRGSGSLSREIYGRGGQSRDAQRDPDQHGYGQGYGQGYGYDDRGDEGFARSESDRWDAAPRPDGRSRLREDVRSYGDRPDERGARRSVYGTGYDAAPASRPGNRWNEGASWTDDHAADRYRGRSYGPERGFLDRASDEVASWFGDAGAEERRREDRYRGVAPKGYTRSDDRIREDVSDRLTDDAFVDASRIEVAVSGSEVTLSGTVTSRDQRRRAEDIADDVSGVTHVQNNLRVGQAGSASGEVGSGTAAGQGPSSATSGSVLGSGLPGRGGTNL